MGTPSVTHEPGATDVALIESWLRRAYPIAHLELTTVTTTATPAPPFNASRSTPSSSPCAPSTSARGPTRTHYYGMVSDGGFFMRGLASGIPQTPRPGTVAWSATSRRPSAGTPTAPTATGTAATNSATRSAGSTRSSVGRVTARPIRSPTGSSPTNEAYVGIDVGDAGLGLPLRVIGRRRLARRHVLLRRPVAEFVHLRWGLRPPRRRGRPARRGGRWPGCGDCPDRGRRRGAIGIAADRGSQPHRHVRDDHVGPSRGWRRRTAGTEPSHTT